MDRIVVVGGSLAGLRTAEALRRGGFGGELVVLGEEQHQPYDRPPLSKQFLAGEWDVDRLWLRVEGGTDLDFRTGARAVSLDVAGRSVGLADGNDVSFDGLVIATGARPRTLPGAEETPGVFVLRTLDDCLALRSTFSARPRIAVIGAGFIGSEVAATASVLGLDVTVIEALPLPLARVLPERVGRACAALHSSHGVALRLGVGVERIEPGRVVLSDGSWVDADVVVVGIGVVPVTDWLEGSALTVDNGVVCDETCAAVGGDGVVVAAGDVARWHNPLFDQVMRVEHWTNAVEQGEAAAANLLAVARGDAPAPFAPVPYFWSDQYDVKIQFVGVASPEDEFRVFEGSVEEARFVAGFGRDGRIVGAIAFTMPRALMKYRAMVAQRASFPG